MQRVYEIHTAVGHFSVLLRGDTAEVHSLMARGGAGALGPMELLALFRQFSAYHPEVRRLVGERISGARFGGAVMGEHDVGVPFSMRLPRAASS